MSVIGPRPGLWNQDLLTAERDKYGANDVRPGVTGWAQINGRDELEIPVKAQFDGEYVKNQSFVFDMNGILNQSIEEYIKHRYNRLNNDLKILLQKSSLLGPEFYSNQLQKTFNLVRVDEELSRIEKLSSLIQKNDNYDKNKYLFETEEVSLISG